MRSQPRLVTYTCEDFEEKWIPDSILILPYLHGGDPEDGDVNVEALYIVGELVSSSPQLNRVSLLVKRQRIPGSR